MEVSGFTGFTTGEEVRGELTRVGFLQGDPEGVTTWLNRRIYKGFRP